MAFEQRSLDDYIDVAQRIADFREKYPEGTLAPVQQGDLPYKIVQAMGWDKTGDQVMQTFIVVVAAAARKPGDPNPGIGMAWEIFPGRTNFTRGSELQNAETSAWGRAIIAVGASDSKRGIASREEVRNRQAERDDERPKHTHEEKSPEGIPWPGCPACLPRNADGSLSRSRTSDAEKAGAGVMTDAEQRAHVQLAKPPPNSGKVERSGPLRHVYIDGALGCGLEFTNDLLVGGGRITCPGCQEAIGAGPRVVDAAVDDRWTSDAPSWLVGVDPPEDQPGSILPAQRSQIMAVYTALGIKDREARLKDMNAVLGAKVPHGSTSDLSHQQAARLLENLHERHTGKTTRR